MFHSVARGARCIFLVICISDAVDVFLFVYVIFRSHTLWVQRFFFFVHFYAIRDCYTENQHNLFIFSPGFGQLPMQWIQSNIQEHERMGKYVKSYSVRWERKHTNIITCYNEI